LNWKEQDSSGHQGINCQFMPVLITGISPRLAAMMPQWVQGMGLDCRLSLLVRTLRCDSSLGNDWKIQKCSKMSPNDKTAIFVSFFAHCLQQS
jgi:hypothetical protein